MTILTLEHDLQEDLRRVLDLLPETSVNTKDDSEFKKSINQLPPELLCTVNKVANIALQILRDNDYVQIRGYPKGCDARSILLIGHAVGEIFDDLTHQASIVSEASPTINATLQGNQTEALFLHTDFAMLNVPPEATIIQCVDPDPLGQAFGENGVSVARHIFSKYFGSKKLELIKKTLLPFAGKKPDGSTVLIMRPILEVCQQGVRLVRFHPSRIHTGFRFKGNSNQQEIDALSTFQEMALKVRIGLPQNSGDIIIVNNHTALHDRGLCSLSLSKNGLSSRISRILFINKLNTKANLNGQD